MSDKRVSRAKWYERCGLASLEDLQSPDLKELVAQLEHSQADFLSREEQFRSPEYNWPRDALHFVARPWEYSYVFSHVRDWQLQNSGGIAPRVMDFGCGVTFFPFCLARKGIEVTAVDVDPIVGRDLGKAMLATPTPSGSVRFVLSSSDNRIPEPDANFDCIYSVSVLEHVPDKISALRELRRLLKPGGYLIVTFDVCLRGGNDLNPRQFVEFMTFAREEFEMVWPERTIHPDTVLNCYNGPYPYRVQAYLKSPVTKLGFAGRTLLRRMRGLPGSPVDYAFMGVVLRKTA